MSINIPVTNLPLLYANNGQITNHSTTPNTKLTIAAFQFRDSTNTTDIASSTVSTLDAATNGANGLDTGSLANSTWYAVHVIGSSYNSAQAAVLLSTSRTAPIMPRNYDVFRQIGWALTDGSAHFLLYNIYGNGNTRTYMWDAVVTELSAAGNTSYTDVDMTSSLPSTSTVAILNWKFVPATAGNTALIRKNGSSSTTNALLTGSVAAQPNAGQLIINTDATQIIEYKTTSGSDALSLFCMGFVDYI
jgi:hypothetical protein